MKKIIFIPTTENHYYNFLPIIKYAIASKNIVDTTLFYIPSIIPMGREFVLEKISNPKEKNLSETIIILDENYINTLKDYLLENNAGLLIVGNDSEPKIASIIRLFKKNNYQIILIQDGWLVADNINNPIYEIEKFYTPIKKFIHKILVSKFSPLKYIFHNFIAQNSDYFFVYSEKAKQEFIKAGISPIKIFLTGSPRHSYYKSLTANLEMDKIVFFSTASYSNEENDAIIESLKWIISICEISPLGKKKLIIKRHPSEIPERFNSLLANTNILVYDKDINSLFLEHKPSVAFCFNSTVILELLVLKIPFIQIIPNSFENKANYHYNLPHARSSEELKDLLKIINRINYLKLGADLLLDVDANFDSIETTYKQLKNLLISIKY